jgi:hypothetical protein
MRSRAKGKRSGTAPCAVRARGDGDRRGKAPGQREARADRTRGRIVAAASGAGMEGHFGHAPGKRCLDTASARKASIGKTVARHKEVIRGFALWPQGHCHPFEGPGGSNRGTEFACPPGMHIGRERDRCFPN